jgi:hypothetical protein
VLPSNKLTALARVIVEPDLHSVAPVHLVPTMLLNPLLKKNDFWTSHINKRTNIDG